MNLLMRYYGILFLSILLLLNACQLPSDASQEEESAPLSNQSTDFTPEGEFTSGIEGPATDKDGNIFAVNFEKQGTIGIVSPEGKASLFVELPEGSIGNGIRIGKDGALFIADYTQHNVLRISPEDKAISTWAHDTMMNQPNDLAIKSDGTLFASDPNWKASTGNLWRINTDGSTSLLEDSMSTTNGLELSPDERLLYVNESVSRKVWVYDLNDANEISNKRLLIAFPDFGMDGMRCDIKGNLYITRHGKGTVVVVNPEGKILREIKLKGKNPTNISFGGPDGKSCYITLQDRGCIETFKAAYPGRSWAMSRKE